jgi:membrane protease YdiL (CAAX protease family)
MWPAVSASVAAALVWIAASELSTPSRIWTTFLVGVLPVLLIVQARATAEALSLPRKALYGSSAISLWILAGATAIAAWASKIGPATLGLVGLPVIEAFVWSAGVTALGVLLLFLARAAGMREAAFLAHLMPRTADEKLLFAGLALTAGFCEELVFRGYLIPVLAVASGSTVVAAVVSSAVFGVLHAYQRPAGAARAAMLGALLAAPLLATGSVIPGMIAHAAIDLLSGLYLRDRLLS